MCNIRACKGYIPCHGGWYSQLCVQDMLSDLKILWTGESQTEIWPPRPPWLLKYDIICKVFDLTGKNVSSTRESRYGFFPPLLLASGRICGKRLGMKLCASLAAREPRALAWAKLGHYQAWILRISCPIHCLFVFLYTSAFLCICLVVLVNL